MHFPDKKETSFNIRARIPTSHKRFSIFRQVVSRRRFFVKKSVLENSGESAAKKRGDGEILANCKLILSFIFLGFRLGLPQGTPYKLIGQVNNHAGTAGRGVLVRESSAGIGGERLGCSARGGNTAVFPEQHVELHFQGLNSFKHSHCMEQYTSFFIQLCFNGSISSCQILYVVHFKYLHPTLMALLQLL